MAPPNKTDNTLPPLMECDPPVSNTASTPTSNRASVHTSVLRTTIQSSTPEPPERRHRTHSQVDPDSPVGFPFTEQRMKELLSEALAPLHKQLEEIQEQARSQGGGQGGHLTPPPPNGQIQRDRKIIHA